MAARQLPGAGEIFLDHIAHFVPDIAAADEALKRCGFVTTPFAAQTAPDAEGAMRPTGTGNVCAMLAEGYIEVLAKTSNTPLADELEAAVARWPGVHLAAFAVAEPEAAYERLIAAGIAMRPMVHLRRPVETENGTGEARFTVLRPQAGVIPEGRIQLLTHHTEAEVWQRRWLNQPNGAEALAGLLIVSGDLAEAGTRFERLLGIRPTESRGGLRFACSRGHVHLAPPDQAEPIVGTSPGLPWVAAYGLRVDSLERTGRFMTEAGIEVRRAGAALIAAFPAPLGKGCWVFVEDDAAFPWNAQAQPPTERGMLP